MTYDILVLDSDGTLTNSEKKITPPTREALIEIQQNGKKVVLASGRPTPGIIPLAKELCLGDYGSYILSFNGGKIINCSTERQSVTKDFRLRLLLPSTRLQTNTMWICSLIQNMRFSQVSSQTNIPNWNPKSTTCQLST